ncbi:hypothetical protein [uncultured Dysosmobacter sp.]|uniref:hypothetical protein n=1 Tax=uncultured Dysosmobacter sp. TaxID=2591384 RepID=UPI0026096509|nr:hypothetical protein [uncultured Dysosmobacter sp.]
MNGQISVFDSVSPAGGSAADSESFGCCHRFRQCSDAGRCLIPDLDYSSACSYRKNLEKGLIFYGKNAAGFSLSEYRDFCSRVDQLPVEVHIEYCRIMVHFWFTEFAASSVLWDNSPALQSLCEAGFCKASPCEDRFLSLCNDKKLRKMLSCHPVYGPVWDSVPPSDDKRKKSFLCAWIKMNAVPFLESLSGKYSLVSLEQTYREYSHEYYHDFLSGKEKEFLVTLPKKRDDFGLFNAT